MQGTMLYGPRDVRFKERPDSAIIEPTDAIIRVRSRRGYAHSTARDDRLY